MRKRRGIESPMRAAAGRARCLPRVVAGWGFVLGLIAAVACVAAAEDPLGHRKGTLVVHAQPGQHVVVEQTRHAFPFGTALSRNAFNGKMDPADRDLYFKTLLDNFNSAVHENALKWPQMQESAERSADFATADRMLGWCEAHGLGMRGHTVLWAKGHRVQSWVKELENEELREATRQRVQDVVERYAGRLRGIDLNNEMLDASFYVDRLGEEIRPQLFRWAAEADPDAVLFVNENDILNGNAEKLDRYVELIRGLLEAGAPVGGIGLQGHLGDEPPDPERYREVLDRLAQFGLPIWITEFDVRSGDEALKAEVLTQLYRVAFEHPAVEGIMMWGFWGGRHWYNNPNTIPGYTSLWSEDWEQTPSAVAYRKLVFSDWWTRAEGATDDRGGFEVSAFAGKYLVWVDGRAHRVSVEAGDEAELDLR